MTTVVIQEGKRFVLSIFVKAVEGLSQKIKDWLDKAKDDLVNLGVKILGLQSAKNEHGALILRIEAQSIDEGPIKEFISMICSSENCSWVIPVYDLHHA